MDDLTFYVLLVALLVVVAAMLWLDYQVTRDSEPDE